MARSPGSPTRTSTPTTRQRLITDARIRAIVRRFDDPDGTATPLGRFDLLQLGGVTVGQSRVRARLARVGARRRGAGAAQLRVALLGLFSRNRTASRATTGRAFEIGAGDLFGIGPGTTVVIGDRRTSASTSRRPPPARVTDEPRHMTRVAAYALSQTATRSSSPASRGSDRIVRRHVDASGETSTSARFADATVPRAGRGDGADRRDRGASPTSIPRRGLRSAEDRVPTDLQTIQVVCRVTSRRSAPCRGRRIFRCLRVGPARRPRPAAPGSSWRRSASASPSAPPQLTAMTDHARHAAAVRLRDHRRRTAVRRRSSVSAIVDVARMPASMAPASSWPFPRRRRPAADRPGRRADEHATLRRAPRGSRSVPPNATSANIVAELRECVEEIARCRIELQAGDAVLGGRPVHGEPHAPATAGRRLTAARRSSQASNRHDDR